MVINTDPKKIEEVLTRGVENIYPNRQTLERALRSGKKLKIYNGIDPTGKLHLGHLVVFKKLRQLQDLGHEIIMLIGDFTGMIGDPTDKLAVRKKLTRKEVLKNAANYKNLASKFLKFSGPNPAKVLYNSQWLNNLTFGDLIELASNFTVQQMIIREMFQQRLKVKKPIYLHEFLYPLSQAYDSVVMDVDLEVGGRDQTFNMLCGRDLMKVLKNKEKFVLATKLLVDPSGRKMGKTEGNLIRLDVKPKEMYGKIMAWPDSLIEIGFELLTDVPFKEVKRLLDKPRQAKARLAREIVKTCHNQRAALLAEKEFNRVFKEKKLPSRIPQIKIKEKSLSILELLTRTKLASSKSEAKRLVLQKGVKIDNKVQDNWQKVIQIKKGLIIRVGKRKFAKLN